MKQYTGNEEFTLRGENSGIRLTISGVGLTPICSTIHPVGLWQSSLLKNLLRELPPPPEYANANRLDAL